MPPGKACCTVVCQKRCGSRGSHTEHSENVHFAIVLNTIRQLHVTDLLHVCYRSSPLVFYCGRRSRREVRVMTLFLVAAHPGLIIVDHIHFQYNGVLLGECVVGILTAASPEVEGRASPGAWLAVLCASEGHLHSGGAAGLKVKCPELSLWWRLCCLV